MKLYLTAPKRRRDEIKGYRDQLVALGHEVLSSWIDLPPDFDDMPDDAGTDPAPENSGNGGESLHMPAPNPAEAALAAQTGNTPRMGDGNGMRFEGVGMETMKSRREIILGMRAAQIYSEVMECEGLVAFTDAQNHTRESAYGEYGGALWLRKKIWIVGGRFAELHCYRDVPCFKTWQAFLTMLAALEGQHRKEQGGA